MDLGIKGRTALVCAASKGLGRACAEALAAEGVNLVITARSPELLEQTATEIRQRFSVTVVTAAGDVTTEGGRAAALAACPVPDILINNAGGPPVGDWRSFERDQWLAAADGNMVAAIMLIRAVIDGMAERKFGRVINITSAMVKQPHAALSLSVAARIGLTGFTKAIAAQYVGANVTINSLLPEQFETDRLRSNIQKLTAKSGRTLDEEVAAAAASSPAKRMGRVEEFGAVCAFYCSVHAGYLTGQNVMLDGGRYPAVF
ncbi:SDR family NAD(P)-dependent oxidoreductase [Bradyrhizobium genosp. L]|uniref:SDR family NAD(P)-dependent oxidoreductase n=1 Tax=Bradyrhizobium genosp. L TaxID=83637 RepID=UPI0018A26503|nr:SDR family NAD(P)-dependent oxidoreductase [Bradyrhizobium genosp. L]QPF87360.1 SDR family NAD(P)-dependent oxidoreductase [Bradyrhizobium genosp. L]